MTSKTTTVTVSDLAEAFARLDSGEGWAFAALVACSVEKQTPGRPLKNASRDAFSSKLSCRKFAEKAGTSDARINRFLAAWDYAADLGLCQPSSELSPEDHATLMFPADDRWSEIFSLSNAKLTAEGQVSADKSAAVLALEAEQAEAVERAEREAALAKREEQLVRQMNLAKQQHKLDLEAEKIKAEKMAAQREMIAAKNAKARAEAVAKEEARRAHRAAELKKAEAVQNAAAGERLRLKNEQIAAAKASAEAAAAARAKMTATQKVEHDRKVKAMLVLHGEVAASNFTMDPSDFQTYVGQSTRITDRQEVAVMENLTK